jgi:hypothetical protein
MTASTEWKETIKPDEDARFQGYAEELAAIQTKNASGGDKSRALHAKGNLGLEAELTVLPDLPDHARQGLFAAPATYRAYVRYSNGAAQKQSDKKPDVRGIAVKVLGVPGKKIIPGMENATTQDFLAIRTASTPVRDADEFLTLVRAAQSPALLPFKLLWNLGFSRGLTLLKQLAASLGQPMTPLAATTYFSALPIQYGKHAVHYSFRPHTQSPPSKPGASPNYLAEELAATLASEAVTYDVCMQFYRDDTTTPIEDASVEWLPENAPWVTVGRLTLSKQDVNSERGNKLRAYVEKLAFDPWHALVEHKPLGNMMRARNFAYRASTQGRSAIGEPTEEFGGLR